MKHHLVSRLTSLVAVDVTPSRPAGARLTPADIPLNLPAGWDFDKVFGPDLAPTGDTRDTRRADAGLVQLAALKVSPTAPAATGTRAQSMMLPQGSTASDWLLWSGFLSFLLALSAWTALAWPRPATAPRR